MQKKLKLAENEVLEKMLDGARCILIATSNGVGIEGRGIEIQATLANLIHNLRYDSGMSEKRIMETVKMGLQSPEEIDKELEDLSKDAEKTKRVLEAIKEIFEN